jgi:capsular exopolysaccharide synthesis family protein
MGLALRHWPLIVSGLLLGVLAGGVLYQFTPPLYNSNSQLLVTKKRPDAIGVDARESPEDYVATQQGLMRTPTLIANAIKIGHLDERPALTPGSVNPNEATLIEAILKQLSVSRQKDSMGVGSNLLNLSFRARSGDDANSVLDAVMEAYREMIAKENARTGDDVRKLLADTRDVLQRQLAEQETAYVEFRKNAPLLWKGKDGVNTHQERLLALETRRTTLLLRRSEMQGKLTALEDAVRAGRDRVVLLGMAADFAVSPEVEGARQSQTGRWQEQVLTLLQQEKKLLEKFGPEHPEVQAVRQNLATARAFLSQPSAAGLGDEKNAKDSDPVQARIASLRQEVEQLDATETRLAQLCTAEREEARKLAAFEIDDETRRNDIQRTQQLFDTLRKQLQDASLIKGAGGIDVRVVAAPGSDGVRKVQPSLFIFGSAGLLIGLMLGGGLAFGAELRDRRYRTPDQVRTHLGVPVIGVVPRLGRSLAKSEPLAIAAPASPATEAIRAVRTAVLAGGNDAVRVLNVSSAGARDGKTLVAANLAIVLAQTGKRVVLVEGNLGEPRIANLFRLPQRPALLSLLRGETPLEEALAAGPSGLTVLAAEAAAGVSGDLVASAAFDALIARLRQRFEIVVIDGPPLLTRADAALLAAHADGTILVVDVQATTRPDAAQALESLRNVRSKVVGVVVNRAAAAAL